MMMVTDLNGATAQASHVVTVSPQPLAVNAVVDDTTGNNNGAFEVNEVLRFTATVTGGTSAYQFLWDFGDGSTDTANPATHSYASEGPRTVSLTVTDANGAQASRTLEVNIVGVRTPPVAVMDLYDDAIAADRKISGQILFITEPVMFDASASHDTNTPALALAYAWDFNSDGVVDSTDPTATFTYNVAGFYTATLTVTNSAGLSDTTSTSGTVYLEAHLTRGKLSWKHHMASGLTQNFIAKARNDASISLNVKLQVNIFNADSGTFVAMVTSPDFPIAPGALRLDIIASWPTPVVLNTTKYTFTGTLLYSVADPVTGNLITGTDDSKSGSFATVP
jgi:PKD repeat protein